MQYDVIGLRKECLKLRRDDDRALRLWARCEGQRSGTESYVLRLEGDVRAKAGVVRGVEADRCAFHGDIADVQARSGWRGRRWICWRFTIHESLYTVGDTEERACSAIRCRDIFNAVLVCFVVPIPLMM